jgi:hypothetical protein
MMLARSHVVAVAALLLLAVSGPSFAAKRTSDTKTAVHAAEPHRPANSSSATRPYDRDPYAPGVNWPGKW